MAGEIVDDAFVKSVVERTASGLGVSADELDYITADLLKEDLAAELEEPEFAPVNDQGEPAALPEACSRIDYGNRLRFYQGYVAYSTGERGTGYKCGNVYRKRWNSRVGDQFNPQARCTASNWWYQLCRPAY